MPGAGASQRVVGAVLAGGQSRRMGRPKALVPLGERPLIAYPVEALRAAGIVPVVVAKPRSALPPLDCEVIAEPVEPVHPLAGLVAALEQSGAPTVIAIGCDMPFVPPALLRLLAEGHGPLRVPEIGGELEPLLARYDASLAPRLREALAAGVTLREAVARIGPEVVPERELERFGDPARIALNVNSHADLERAEGLLDNGPRAIAGRTYAVIEREGVQDHVAVEEPLEISVDGEPLAVTMRTPGHDEELALGFLHGEGLIDGPRPVGPPADLGANAVDVKGPLLRDPGERSFYATSSCGVCGKGALEQIAVYAEPVSDGPRVGRSLLASLPDRLRQPTFERTGGLHATGIFDPSGGLLAVREDVGRHNAMDKAIGRMLMNEALPLSGSVLCVSGRLSFELVQKAAVAGVPILVGVGAPSSLAIKLAEDRGLTLCGFARRGRMNVYSRPDRVG